MLRRVFSIFFCTVSGCDGGNRTRNIAVVLTVYTWRFSLLSYVRLPRLSYVRHPLSYVRHPTELRPSPWYHSMTTCRLSLCDYLNNLWWNQSNLDSSLNWKREDSWRMHLWTWWATRRGWRRSRWWSRPTCQCPPSTPGTPSRLFWRALPPARLKRGDHYLHTSKGSFSWD